jgi:hypothetical protein
LTIVFSNGPTILERGLAFLVLADEVYMAFWQDKVIESLAETKNGLETKIWPKAGYRHCALMNNLCSTNTLD